MAKIKICPMCGTENSAGLLECTCGYDLTFVRVTDTELNSTKEENTPTDPPPVLKLVRICSECGAVNPSQTRKCLQCGEDISDVVPTIPAQADPVPKKETKLLALQTDDGYTFTLEGCTGEMILGRGGEMSEYLRAANKRYVARRQAVLQFQDDGVYLANSGAMNPNFVNDVPVKDGEPVRLKEGDTVSLAGCTIDGERQEMAAYFRVIGI